MESGRDARDKDPYPAIIVACQDVYDCIISHISYSDFGLYRSMCIELLILGDRSAAEKQI